MLTLVKPIIPCLRLYLHDYMGVATRRRNPQREYLEYAERAAQLGYENWADIFRGIAVATEKQRTIIQEDFELSSNSGLKRDEILRHVRDYYIWQNYSHIRDTQNGPIYQQNMKLHLINLGIITENLVYVTVLECH